MQPTITVPNGRHKRDQIIVTTLIVTDRALEASWDA